MLVNIVIIISFGIFIYLVVGIFRKGHTWKERFIYLIAAFVGLPIFTTVMMLLATYIDPVLNKENREEALALAATSDNDKEIIQLLDDYREHEDVVPVITAAMRREVLVVPAADIDENLKRYEDLAALLPEDTEIMEKAAYYSEKVRQRDQAEQAARETERRAEEQARQLAQEEREAAAEKRRLADNLKSNQLVLCQMTIERASKFPTKVDFEWGFDYYRLGESGHTVTGRVELMNGFGNMIPHTYRCDFLETVLLDFNVEPG